MSIWDEIIELTKSMMIECWSKAMTLGTEARSESTLMLPDSLSVAMRNNFASIRSRHGRKNDRRDSK
ncbi:MAG: hypothetical protein IPK13_27645 [Deltaproteobacteria bacterium]|nr:hypothetical protein [Deltaproteobacteria bacterium]